MVGAGVQGRAEDGVGRGLRPMKSVWKGLILTHPNSRAASHTWLFKFKLIIIK